MLFHRIIVVVIVVVVEAMVVEVVREHLHKKDFFAEVFPSGHGQSQNYQEMSRI